MRGSALLNAYVENGLAVLIDRFQVGFHHSGVGVELFFRVPFLMRQGIAFARSQHLPNFGFRDLVECVEVHYSNGLNANGR